MLLDDDDAGLMKRLSTITDLGLKSSGEDSFLLLAGRGIIDWRNANRGVVSALSGGAGKAMLLLSFFSIPCKTQLMLTAAAMVKDATQ